MSACETLSERTLVPDPAGRCRDRACSETRAPASLHCCFLFVPALLLFSFRKTPTRSRTRTPRTFFFLASRRTFQLTHASVSGNDMKSAVLALVAATAVAHDGLPINPELGVPGFPDCQLPGHLRASDLSVDEAAHAIVCKQRVGASNDTIKVRDTTVFFVVLSACFLFLTLFSSGSFGRHSPSTAQPVRSCCGCLPGCLLNGSLRQ